MNCPKCGRTHYGFPCAYAREPTPTVHQCNGSHSQYPCVDSCVCTATFEWGGKPDGSGNPHVKYPGAYQSPQSYRQHLLRFTELGIGTWFRETHPPLSSWEQIPGHRWPFEIPTWREQSKRPPPQQPASAKDPAPPTPPSHSESGNYGNNYGIGQHWEYQSYGSGPTLATGISYGVGQHWEYQSYGSDQTLAIPHSPYQYGNLGYGYGSGLGYGYGSLPISPPCPPSYQYPQHWGDGTGGSESCGQDSRSRTPLQVTTNMSPTTTGLISRAKNDIQRKSDIRRRRLHSNKTMDPGSNQTTVYGSNSGYKYWTDGYNHSPETAPVHRGYTYSTSGYNYATEMAPGTHSVGTTTSRPTAVQSGYSYTETVELRRQVTVTQDDQLVRQQISNALYNRGSSPDSSTMEHQADSPLETPQETKEQTEPHLDQPVEVLPTHMFLSELQPTFPRDLANLIASNKTAYDVIQHCIAHPQALDLDAVIAHLEARRDYPRQAVALVKSRSQEILLARNHRHQVKTPHPTAPDTDAMLAEPASSATKLAPYVRSEPAVDDVSDRSSEVYLESLDVIVDDDDDDSVPFDEPPSSSAKCRQIPNATTLVESPLTTVVVSRPTLDTPTGEPLDGELTATTTVLDTVASAKDQPTDTAPTPVEPSPPALRPTSPPLFGTESATRLVPNEPEKPPQLRPTSPPTFGTPSATRLVPNNDKLTTLQDLTTNVVSPDTQSNIVPVPMDFV